MMINEQNKVLLKTDVMSKCKTIERKVILLMLVLLVGNTLTMRAQGLALKSNILYDATTTPNAGIELKLSNK